MEITTQELAQLIESVRPPSPRADEVPASGEKFQIVVLDRGWVYAGRVRIDGDLVTIRDAKDIRRWGTSRGLGELAKEGPKEGTKMDDYGTVTAPMRAVIHFIDITSGEGKWA